LIFNHEFNPIFHAQLVGSIPPLFLEVSISDTREHPLGVYLKNVDIDLELKQFLPFYQKQTDLFPLDQLKILLVSGLDQHYLVPL
jgi:hypothetical protein